MANGINVRQMNKFEHFFPNETSLIDTFYFIHELEKLLSVYENCVHEYIGYGCEYVCKCSSYHCLLLSTLFIPLFMNEC